MGLIEIILTLLKLRKYHSVHPTLPSSIARIAIIMKSFCNSMIPNPVNVESLESIYLLINYIDLAKPKICNTEKKAALSKLKINTQL